MDTSKIFKNHLLLLKLLEIFPHNKSNSSIYFRFFACVVRIVSTICFVSFCMQLKYSKSFPESCETMCLTSTVFKCIMSALHIQFKHLDIHELNKQLRILDGYVKGEDEIKVLEKCLKTNNYWFIYFVGNLFGVLAYCELIILTSAEPVLPLKMWFPIDWQSGGLRFTLAHIAIISCIFLSAIMEILGDTLPPAALGILCGHLRALSLRVEKIQLPAAHEKHLAYMELLNCIKAYQIVMKAFVIVEQILKIPSGLQFLNSVIAQCSLAAYMIYVGMKSDKIVLLILMFIVLTFICLVLCSYGELLQQESANFSYAVYACNWTSQNVQFRKTLLQFLLQSQKILQIKAANLFPLNMETFYKIMKMNYSLFALLNQFLEK